MHWFNHSRLFDLARRGQRLTHIAAVIPLSFIFAIVAQFGVIPLVIALGAIYGFNETGISLAGIPNTTAGLLMGMQLTFAFVLVYAILWAWLKWFEKRPFWTLGYEMKDALTQYGRGFLIGALMFAGSVGILALFGSVSFEQGDPSKQGLAAVAGVMLVLLGWIVQGADTPHRTFTHGIQTSEHAEQSQVDQCDGAQAGVESV